MSVVAAGGDHSPSAISDPPGRTAARPCSAAMSSIVVAPDASVQPELLNDSYPAIVDADASARRKSSERNLIHDVNACIFQNARIHWRQLGARPSRGNPCLSPHRGHVSARP